MSIWIIYSLVIVFLLAFPLLVLAFVRSPEASAQMGSNDTNTAKSNGIAYGLLLAFFVFFTLLTFALQRGKSSQK
jgi:Na+-driven multidrug efflux pump